MTSTTTEAIAQVARNVERLSTNIGYVIQGKPEVIHHSVVCLLAEGHLLLEDVPGTGKTSLARALATSLSIAWNRIQVTPTCCPRTSRACRSTTRAATSSSSGRDRSSPTSCS